MKKSAEIFCAFAALFILFLLPCFTVKANASDISEIEFDIPDEAGAVYLYSYDADRVLLCKNGYEQIPPASTAKVMTGLIFCEFYSDRLDDRITLTEEMLYGVKGNSMNLQVGMTVTYKDLLYGTVCGGNNDAAQALAIACMGSVKDSVREMNAFAKLLYMNNTHYDNPTGYDSNGAYTTLNDSAKLMHRAAKNSLYMEASSAVKFEFAPEGFSATVINSRNALANGFSSNGYINKYANGIIAGNTDLGGYVLAAQAEKNGMKYLCLIMGASADGKYIYSYYTANKLFDRVFGEYSYKKIADAGDVFEKTDVSLSVDNGERGYLSCVLAEDAYAFLPDETDLKKDITFVTYLHDASLQAPVKQGSVLGGVDVYANGVFVGSYKLVARSDVEANYILYFLKEMKDFFTSRLFILTVALSVPAITVYLVIDKRKTRYKRVGTIKFQKFS